MKHSTGCLPCVNEQEACVRWGLQRVLLGLHMTAQHTPLPFKSYPQQTVPKVCNTIFLLISHHAYNHLAFTLDSACILVRWFKCHLVSDNMSEVHIRFATHAYLWWRKVCWWHTALNYAGGNLNIKANMSNMDCNFYVGRRVGGGGHLLHTLYIFQSSFEASSK